MGVMNLKKYQLTQTIKWCGLLSTPKPLIRIMAMETSKSTDFFQRADLIWRVRGVIQTYACVVSIHQQNKQFKCLAHMEDAWMGAHLALASCMPGTVHQG